MANVEQLRREPLRLGRAQHALFAYFDTLWKTSLTMSLATRDGGAMDQFSCCDLSTKLAFAARRLMADEPYMMTAALEGVTLHGFSWNVFDRKHQIGTEVTSD